MVKISVEIYIQKTEIQQTKSLKPKTGSLGRSVKWIKFQPNWLVSGMTGDITTDSTDNKNVIREYYEQLYAYKFYNKDEMEKFIKRYTLPNFTQEQTT